MNFRDELQNLEQLAQLGDLDALFKYHQMIWHHICDHQIFWVSVDSGYQRGEDYEERRQWRRYDDRCRKCGWQYPIPETDQVLPRVVEVNEYLGYPRIVHIRGEEKQNLHPLEKITGYVDFYRPPRSQEYGERGEEKKMGFLYIIPAHWWESEIVHRQNEYKGIHPCQCSGCQEMRRAAGFNSWECQCASCRNSRK